MPDCIISVEDLSKRYVIGHRRDSYDGLRHSVEAAFRTPFRWLKRQRQAHVNSREDFWALRDVSLQISRGEVVGIIGRNGAGKSTLLKILSRITEPTKGKIRIRGRVASLLEVGTGFHQELTGRENIFLNGAILGMTKAEIVRKFDEIVAFSEIEKFIDTPVKRYSSGMYVRLAFAVAAHLEPEILIVDEVLAVGDAAFQSKCIGKMRQVSRGGRTVLFVSHNINAITTLCSKAVVLKQGRVTHIGEVRDALLAYGASGHVSDSFLIADHGAPQILESIHIAQDGRSTGGLLHAMASIAIDFRLNPNRRMARPRLAIAFNNVRSERVFAVGSWLGPSPLPPIETATTVRIAFTLPPLVPGRYSMDIGLYDHEAGVNEEHHAVGAIEIVETNFLQMIEPGAAELGQIYVKSNCFITELNGQRHACHT
jgi:lipopolysaccharide transport system ATP-binding protein